MTYVQSRDILYLFINYGENTHYIPVNLSFEAGQFPMSQLFFLFRGLSHFIFGQQRRIQRREPLCRKQTLRPLFQSSNTETTLIGTKVWFKLPNYPPHFRPRAIRADFRRSSPREASSSQLEKAESSKWAPTFARADPVSFCFRKSVL